jgi:membrane protein
MPRLERARDEALRATTPFRAGVRVFFSRDGRFQSGAIAFYALLSAVPLSYLTLFVATRFVPREDAHAAFASELGRWTGPALAEALFRWSEQARESRSMGALSLVVLLYSATRLFAALERGINTMWEIDTPSEAKGTLVERALRQARTRGLAFVVVTVLGLVLAAVVGFRAAISAADRAGGELAQVSRAVSWVGSIAVATLLFFLLYTVLPRIRARAKETLGGAFLSALLFLGGAHVVTSYVAHKGDVGLGETLLVLLWLRYAAQVFLLGAAVVGVALRARGALPTRTPPAAEP